MKDRNLVDYIPWNEVTPQLLREKITSILADSENLALQRQDFNLTGLETMHSRLDHFKAESIRFHHSESDHSSAPAHQQ